MRRTLRRSLAALITAAVAVAAILTLTAQRAAGRPTASRAQTTAADPGPAVAASNRLALALLRRLGGAGNVVFSPYSIQAALAMVDQGAAGQTAAQIDHVLGATGASGLALSNDQLRADLAAAVAPPSGADPTRTAQLDVANGLWLQSGFAVNPAFTGTLTQDFGAAPQTADFQTSADAARQAINQWVAARTANLIPSLFPAGSITAATKLVLANAIYLKARWVSPFDSALTQPAPFYPQTGPKVMAPFMHSMPGEPTSFPYGRGKGYVAVALPYSDSSLSMLAIMPKAGTLPAFQRSLTPTVLAAIARSLTTHPVAVSMPKLSLSIQSNLNTVLAGLGMPAAFTSAADFSNISSTTQLAIQTVEHAAVMKVDEAGTVAAAATGVTIAPTAIAVTPSVPVTLNHPFLLFLRDDRTGAVLFAARVVTPSSN